MSKKLVKSTDDRKAPLIALFKAKSGGNKITNVYEFSDGSYCANAHKSMGGRQYQLIGAFTVTQEELDAVGVTLDAPVDGNTVNLEGTEPVGSNNLFL